MKKLDKKPNKKLNIYEEAEKTFEKALWVSQTMDRIVEADRIRDEEYKADIEKWIQGARDFIAGGSNNSLQHNVSATLTGEEAHLIDDS